MINFYTEEVVFPALNFKDVKQWIKKIIENHKFKLGDVSIIFCNDEYLLSINKTYLNHNYYTDIITFNYNNKNVLSGDIFISVDTVKLNAKEFAITESDEFLRVIIHGILHLLGFNDSNDEEKLEMRRKENESLELFFN